LNKKGEGELLPEETLKIIIAVICIAGLIVLIIVIYFSVTGDQDMKKVQEVLSRFANETKRINSGEINNVTFLFPNPKGWYVFSFVEQNVKPNSCAGKNCLCVCEKLSIGIVNVDSRQAQRCDSKGACVTIVNLKKFNPIEIKSGGIFVSINKINDLIEIIK
jgi:hypothetical protein